MDALALYGPEVTTPTMTGHLEDRMTAIAEGRATLADVVGESRDALRALLVELRSHEGSLARWLRDATFFETDYGPCDACGEGRFVRRRAPNGWTFLGCSAFPKCRRRMRFGEAGQRIPWGSEAATAADAIPATA